MALTVGSEVPDVQLHVLGENGMPAPVSSREVLGTGKVVLFAVPGAFTPGCSRVHLPGFVQGQAELRNKGVDVVACISVNDPWVMKAWADSQGAEGILMLSDGSGAFAQAMGLTMDGSGFGLGARSQRYAAVIENGVFTSLDVEPGPGIDVSTCSAVIGRL
jgi:peroxiredoxin